MCAFLTLTFNCKTTLSTLNPHHKKLHCKKKHSNQIHTPPHGFLQMTVLFAIVWNVKKASEAALSLHRMFSIKFAKRLMQHPELYGKKDPNHNKRSSSQIYEEREFVNTSSSSDSDWRVAVFVIFLGRCVFMEVKIMDFYETTLF